MIKDIAGHFTSYPDYFITTFSQISAGNMENLRKALKKDSAVYMVVKNSMLKRAIEASEKDIDLFDEVRPSLSGSCGVLFSKNDPATTARSLVLFNKNHETLKIQGGFIDGEKISSETIKLLATLPSREVLLAMVAFSMQAPIAGFVGLLGNLLRNIVGVIGAISKKKAEA